MLVPFQIEDAFTKLEFPFLTIFRPGLLDRKQHQRFQEKLAGKIEAVFAPSILQNQMYGHRKLVAI